jgi:putative nucleotidyltransferase with HDIG domain
MPSDPAPPAGETGAFSPLVERLRPHLAAIDTPIYLVGGAVRDALLGRLSHDLDYAVPANAISLTLQLGDALGLPAYAMDDERDVGRIVLPDDNTTIDIARFRGPDLESDLRGRDFTINAFALPAAATDLSALIDRFNGLRDLAEKRVRIIHAGSIEADPIRALRAVRLAHQLSFSLADDTAIAAREASGSLGRVSNERIREELTRILLLSRPQDALHDLFELGLLETVLPELAQLAGVVQTAPHFEPVLPHTLRVLGYAVDVERVVSGEPGRVEGLEALLAPYRNELAAHLARSLDGGAGGALLLRLGALWHDAGKRQTQTVEPDGRVRFFGHDEAGAEIAGRRLRRLTFSGEAVAHVQRIVRGHMRPLLLSAANRLPSRRAVYRYYRDLGSAGLDVGLLSLADHLATADGPGDSAGWDRLLAVIDRLFAGYFHEHDLVVAPVRLLTGSELIVALGLQPGPEVGRLLKIIEEAQAAGEVTEREEALALARQAHASA